MKLTRTTDYAIRIVCFLATENSLVSASVLAEKLDIPFGYVTKVVKNLKDIMLIEAVDGSRGGYRLLLKPENITLGTVVYAMERDRKVFHLLDEGDNSPHKADDALLLEFYQSLQAVIDEKLNTPISKILVNPPKIKE